MQTSEKQVPLKKYIYKIFKTKALSEKFNKPKNNEEIKYLFINNFIDTIYIPIKNNHRTRDKITMMGNYLFPKFEEVPYPIVMEPNLVIEYYSNF